MIRSASASVLPSRIGKMTRPFVMRKLTYDPAKRSPCRRLMPEPARTVAASFAEITAAWVG